MGLIRADDVRGLAELFREGEIKRIADRLHLSSRQRILSAWEHVDSDRSNWWDLKEVTQRWNRLITGNPSLDYQTYVTKKYFSNSRKLKAASIGCGTGAKEMMWAATGKYYAIEAYDISAPRIQRAVELAEKSKWKDKVNFSVGDAFQLELPPGSLDVVIFDNSLHHLSPLKPIVEKARNWLGDRGILVLNEYVGPDRFQWTDEQVEITNAVLRILPPELRVMENGRIKERMERHGSLAMRLNDPSEAAESSTLLKEVERYFRIVELKMYGGTILANLFKGIAHNFQGNNAETRKWVALAFTIEDRLLEIQTIPSDYVFAVLKK